MNKVRLDLLLTERGLTESREKARTAIKNGQVFVAGQCIEKPGMMVDSLAAVELRGEVCPYVSRGGWKLEKALAYFHIDPTGYVCSDCGASTGGFTDCLLQKGARKVFAIDVGSDQLAEKLRDDPRVVSMEHTNVRHITPGQLCEQMDLCVIDVSFISLQLVLPAVAALLKESGRVICLIKPQFEAGKERVGKNGVVRDAAVHADVVRDVCRQAETLGLGVQGVTFSPVKGPEGNIEFLALLQRGAKSVPADIQVIVRQAHDILGGAE